MFICFIGIVGNIISVKGYKVETERIILPISEKIIGDCLITINQESSEILIDNFTRCQIGIEGLNVISWPSGFSFEELDKFTYLVLKSKDFKKTDVRIFFRYLDKDQYGNTSPAEWVFLGQINVDEAVKYQDFQYWPSQYTISKMFRKNVAP